MNTSLTTEASPHFKARMAGFFWLATILTSTFAYFVGGRFIVYGDAAETASNIVAHFGAPATASTDSRGRTVFHFAALSKE